MNKPHSLRAFVEAALPELAANPDRLLMFIEEGRMAAGLGSLSFEYHFTVTVVITDWTSHPDAVMVPILQWLHTNQPDLLQHPDKQKEAVTFQAELLNHTTMDLQIKLKLSERVRVTADGAIHLPEPQLDPL
jgi:hypothetical protein